MNTNYDIYRNLGFIGNVEIRLGRNQFYGALTLFEAVPDGVNLELVNSTNVQNTYKLATTHHQTIVDLLNTVIPNLRNNDLTYHYSDENDNQTII